MDLASLREIVNFEIQSALNPSTTPAPRGPRVVNEAGGASEVREDSESVK
jgi:hypothetical protein